MRFSGTFAIIAATGLLALSAAAQTTSTEILGTVTDSSGALVPGAKVTLLRVATQERRETFSTSAGDYSFPLIEIGEYVVTVSREGFKTQEKTGVVVELQQKARVNFELTVGEASQRVVVEATGVELKTDDAALGGVVENKRVIELPLNGRNIGALAILTAGVQWDAKYGVTDTGATGFPIPGRNVQIVANGQRGANQQITLDGVIATDPLNNAMIFTPSIDAIEEFKVQTGSYSAEYGVNNGALVQVALKSGTNQLRGTLYEFLRNDSMDAKDYFLNFQVPAGSALTPKNRLRRNQFGAFFGGPVLLPKVYNGRDRTFWSFSYEGVRQTQDAVQNGYFFPQAFRNGDFSALLQPPIVNGKPIRAPIIISDPLTGAPFTDAQGNITNIIPPSRINKNAQNFINKYQPPPMFQSADILANNVQTPVPSTVYGNQYYFRIDHEFRQQDKVFVRLAADRPDATTGNINPNFPRLVVAPATNLAFQYIHLFSPRTLNEFRYGLNKASPVYSNPRTGTNFDLNSLGIGNFLVSGNRPLTSLETGIPATLIGGDSDNGGLNINHASEHQFSDNFSFMRGSHGFKAGFEFRRLLTFQSTSNNPRGIIGSSASEGGYNLAGWLMGYIDNATTPEGLPPSALNQNRWSAYFLDDWKVSRKLTMNLGLRWDLFQVPLDAIGGVRSLRLDVLTQASDGRMLPTLVPAPHTKNFALTSSDNRYFMPRVGLAYRATEKWIVRSGFGWFVNAQQLANFAILARQPPNGGAVSFNQVTQVAQLVNYSYAGQSYSLQTRKIQPGTPVLTLDNAFPNQSTPARTNLLILGPNNRFPNVAQWSLDVQRALPFKSVLTVAYVGSKSSNIDNTINQWNNPLPSPNTDINSRRPYQAFVSQGEGNDPRGIGSLRYLDSYANGSYEGLQTTFEKHYSQGLLVNVAYTFSKALGEGYERNSGQVNGGTYQDPQNRRADRARYPFDVTHNGVISFVYEMPFLNRFKGVTGGFLAGWQANGIVTLHTGYPFGLAGGNLNTGGSTRPDRIADGRLGSEATRQRWFDPSAFRRTDCNIPNRLDLCHFGTAANDVLISPGMRNLDLSLYKNWRVSPLGEAGRIQFRVEAFNAFNTPHFGQPIGIGFVSPDSIVPDAPQQGEIRSLLSPMRILQLGLKVYF